MSGSSLETMTVDVDGPCSTHPPMRHSLACLLEKERTRELKALRAALADLQDKHHKLKVERDALIDHARLPRHWKDMADGDVLDHLKEQRRRLREEFGGQEPCFGAARPVDRTPYGGYYDPSAPCYRPKNDDDGLKDVDDGNTFLPVDPTHPTAATLEVYCPTPTKYRRLDLEDQHSHSV